MNDNASEAQPVPSNVVVLNGHVRGAPTSRALPSGATVVHFDVATTMVDGDRTHLASVPVAWVDPGAAALATVVEGAEVVVTGTVHRRFFRVGGATQSRTEVLADAVILSRRRQQVRNVLRGVADRLVG